MALCHKRIATNAADRSIEAAVSHAYSGLWATADGFIRQQLSADGRYEEGRGPRRRAATGSYSVTGDRIEYVEDATGFTAHGWFEDGVLHHAGMTLFRRD